jgi:aryl-alcohol dehydrogenase-like predicted oxidoreductase
MDRKSKISLKEALGIEANNLSKKVALGTFSFKDLTEREMYEILEKYFASGRIFIDTAAFYGNRYVEKSLGKILSKLGVNCFIATKVGYFQRKEHYRSFNYIYDQIKYSQELLGRKINLLQIHEADWDVWWESNQHKPISREDVINSPIIELLLKLKKENEVDFIGITGNNADKLAFIVECLEDIDTVLVAKQYDLLWRNGRQSLRNLIKEKGLFYIVGAPFHQGKLINLDRFIAENRMLNNDEIATEAEKLQKLINYYGLDLVKTCIEFILTDYLVDLTLVGVKNTTELWWTEANLNPIHHEIYEELLNIGFIMPPSQGIPFNLK